MFLFPFKELINVKGFFLLSLHYLLDPRILKHMTKNLQLVAKQLVRRKTSVQLNFLLLILF